MADALLPDAEALLVAALAAHPAFASLQGRVSSRLPETAAWPRLQVTRVGGAPTQPWEDEARLQVDAWGGTKAEALDLARAVVSIVPDLRGPHPGGGRVSGGYVVLGPLWSPDPETDRPRYLVDLAIRTHP